jgi:zinc transport system substrate-binding protein
MKSMKSLVILLLIGFMIGGCAFSNGDTSIDEELVHTSGEIEIEGIADHYHTGDTIELTAMLNEDVEYDHWHWYTKESEESEWKIASGQETEAFIGEVIIGGLKIKAILYDNDHEIYAESSPVTVVIDDHHGHDEDSKKIYQGYFEDGQVEERELSDWEGDWQSVYRYLLNGELDDVFEHKAEEGDMTAEEYKEYYTIGYETDVDRITIEDNVVIFFTKDQQVSGEYSNDGYEILDYEAGNRGVRYSFKLVDGSEGMPQYIQFSDHNVFPTESHHFHLYWGDSREDLLEEVINWPTYYPSNLDADGLVRDMLSH